MIINKIRLENIRSYLNEKIEFPKGSLLLAGNIGSGKSSVLLAIDFALFGLQRGTLDGSALLRNGKNKGSVELDFNIDNKNIIIKRNLKRSADTATQDSGYIIIDNKKKEATAQELKQAVLELLCYPKELLTKSKALIYRYTVYTPQEEMKQILLVDKDIRLDTLRKVFGIDKYKRIKENSKIFTTKIREKKKEFDGMLTFLPERQKEREQKGKNLDLVENKLLELKEPLKKLSSEIKEKKDSIKKIEQDINKLNELKKELRVNENDLKNKLEQVKDIEKDISYLEKESLDIKKEIEYKEKLNIKDIEKDIKDKENEIRLMEETLEKINYKINEFNIKKEGSEDIKERINKLDVCPTCKQVVSKEHKHSIVQVEKEKIQEYIENLSLYEKEDKEARKKLVNLKKELEESKEKSYSIELTNLKIRNLENKTSKIEELKKTEERIKKEIGKINSENSILFEEIEKIKDIEKTYEESKEELENLREKEKSLEIKKVSYESEINNLKEVLTSLDNEISECLKIKDNLNYLAQIQFWIDNHFIKLMNTVERHIMLKVHSDFNSLFENWFDILVDSENLSIKLNDEFTPIIEQDGYNLDYNFLSGGEKTAAALAYRLSLNQVINNLISTIKTKDLLILDEPTDGFSDEQIDRIRLVLDELNIKQIIIVSHESKIESFVDNVIRFEKKGHISKVIENI